MAGPTTDAKPLSLIGKMKGGAKWAGIAGLVAGAAAVAPFVISGLRNNRRFDADSLPPTRELSDPLPEVMEYVPPPQVTTMMGVEPVEGEMARKIKMQRAGISAGIDPSSPSIMRPDGRNAIDGSASVADLGAVPGGRTF